MKNLTRKLSALALAALFTSMQVTATAIDTGLGAGNGGAVINNATGGFKGCDVGNNTATLNFEGNSHVNWDTLNVNKGQELNFNATNGASGITVLNTVNSGMSKIYGDINANDGISKLIISNPNGMLFDGAKFTTAGDLILTTKDMSNLSVDDLDNAKYTKMYSDGKLIPVGISNSTFNVNGDYTIMAPYVSAEASNVTANTFKIVTANGADYASVGAAAPVNNKGVTFLKAMMVNGNVEIMNPEGAVSISDGGTINGNLKVESKGNTFVNFYNEGNKKLTIDGNADVKSHGQWALVRKTDINGNLNMSNDGGFVDVGDANITGNANLTTTGIAKNNNEKYNHYVHVIGNTNVGGDLTIESSENIHIGGYDYDARQLADGKLTVNGDLYAHATDGHITTTIDTSAKNITYKSDKYNILTDGKAVLTADTYDFTANGYIGGIKDYTNKSGVTISNDTQIVDIMEGYRLIPADIESHDYLNIAGGEIKNITTPKTAEVYIASEGDVLLTGANTNNINLVAPDKYIHITGPNVHANNINIGGRTDKVEVDFPSRDFTLNYTNIRDGVVKTVNKTDVITYELTNDPDKGYNTGKEQTADTTFLVGPTEPPVVPPDEPVIPPKPPVDPPVVPDDEPERNLAAQWVPEDAMKAPVDTPVAFAADLDDDDNGIPVRKNVDGSVTVVRAVAAN